MSKPLLETLDQLIQLHQDFLKVAEEKADVLKNKDVSELQVILKKEQTYVAAIQTLEKRRMEQASSFISKDNATLADIIEEAEPLLKQHLEQKRDELILAVANLAQQNELNRELTITSLQFVNMTINMLRPKNDTMNYSNMKRKPQRMNQSMFDSRT
ncbi:flagellar protein FlgN [Jeotgalibacillus sp. R-1-5s-1]|uniref:flagellar protein FlgN n=1 Tax=Jeotgalibacillus sp. R-1-5s-1 TaxID=2555897 RepID=UPI00106D7FE8|nr:flagellar protein FlgN [Jeotgalibacillus sp. R-1-5s-1]TFD95786.1 flagellar protein FlgN [Jeotgalibacillus sp. R-1-5s-1]